MSLYGGTGRKPPEWVQNKSTEPSRPQRNGHSDAAPQRDDLEKVVRGCAVRVHSGLVHRSKQQLYPFTSSARLSVSGPHVYCFWSSSRNLCLVGRYILLLALVGLLVGVKLHSVLATFDETRQLCAEQSGNEAAN